MARSLKKTYCEEIGERIRLERERLDMTQAAFAELAGLGRATQIFYENNDRQPDTKYFEKLRQHGIDVDYLLTGQRTRSMYNDAEWLHFKNEILWASFSAAVKIGLPEASAASVEASLAAFKAFCTVYSGRNDDAALIELQQGTERLERCA